MGLGCWGVCVGGGGEEERKWRKKERNSERKKKKKSGPFSFRPSSCLQQPWIKEVIFSSDPSRRTSAEPEGNGSSDADPLRSATSERRSPVTARQLPTEGEVTVGWSLRHAPQRRAWTARGTGETHPGGPGCLESGTGGSVSTGTWPDNAAGLIGRPRYYHGQLKQTLRVEF